MHTQLPGDRKEPKQLFFPQLFIAQHLHCHIFCGIAPNQKVSCSISFLSSSISLVHLSTIMINLSLTDEELHHENDGGLDHHILDDTSKDIVNDDALWADFQTRCRQSKEGHTNFNTQQILAEFMEERQRQRQAKAASRATNNETSSLDDMQSLGNRSFSSLDSFRSNPEQESNSNLFQAAANTTRRFRRTTMNMLSNTFEDAASSVSSAQHPPAQAPSSQPPRARRQRATMSMVSNYVMPGGNSADAENTAPRETIATRQWARTSSIGHGMPTTSHNMPERSIYDMAREAAPILAPQKNASPKPVNIKFPDPPSAKAMLYSNRQSSLTLEDATVSISSLNTNSSTGNISVGGGKNSSMSSLVGKFVQRARSSLADEEVDSDYD